MVYRGFVLSSLRCFSFLIQISICVCVSHEDCYCSTYQELLSRYANVESQERVKVCVPAFAPTKGAGDMLGWISCSKSKGDTFKQLRAAHGFILNSCTDIVHVRVCAFVSIYIHTFILSHFS